MKFLRWFIIILLLAGGVVLCVIRWQAWFGMPAEPQWAGDTLHYEFNCFGDDSVHHFVRTKKGWQDTQEPAILRIVLFGDVHNSLTTAELDTIAARHDTIDAYAQLGDMIERNYFYYQQKLKHEIAPSKFADIPLMATPGNHEYIKGIVPRIDSSWFTIFHNPMNGPVDFKGSSYYVDFPKLRFIVIDTQGLFHIRDYTRVLTWYNRARQTAGDRFVVVMMHHPIYSSSKGRQNLPLRLYFRRALSKADLVFAGHDHNYARRTPFVDTNSAKKFYRHNYHPRFEKIGENTRFYEVLSLSGRTLLMQTYILETGELYDEVLICPEVDAKVLEHRQ